MKRRELFKKYNIVWISLFLVIISSLFFGFISKKQYEKISINENKFIVETVSKNADRKKGLSGRQFLCDECGMLFLFEEKGIYKFWMKDMCFDIDILWINDDKVVDITTNASYKTPKKSIKPKYDINAVLEIVAGSVLKYDIRVGDKVFREKE